MSKHMNPTTQSDGIVLAEEASFSDAARVKGPHRKTSSTIVDLKLMEGFETIKFGFFNDASNLSLAQQVWSQWFFYNPKSAGDNLNSNLFWRDVGWSSEKKDSPKKILF